MIKTRTLFGGLGNTMFQMAYLYAQVKKGIIPDLYVQDIKYFQDYEDEIKAWYGGDIGYLPYVAIHLRRGDYVGNSFYCQLWETGYYIDAVNLFPNRKFLVFSDDIEFAKIYLEGDKFAFDDSENEIDALNKMASCDSQIIANSSFSWWAGFLNNNPSKKVVAPSVDKWFTDKQERIKCPDTWVRI